MLKNVTVEPCGFISFVYKIFPFLQIYAASFFVIPLIWWIIIRKTNARIEKRNQAREMSVQAPARCLPQTKILSAQDMSQRTMIGQDRIVYTTQKDVYEQEYDKMSGIEDLKI